MSGNVPIPTEKDPYKIARAIRELFEGRSNAVGSFTLAANAASTTVTSPMFIGVRYKLTSSPLR